MTTKQFFSKYNKQNCQNQKEINVNHKLQVTTQQQQINYGYICNNFQSISLSSQILEHINNYTKRKQSSILTYSTNEKSKGQKLQHNDIKEFLKYQHEKKKQTQKLNQSQNCQIIIKQQWSEKQIERIQEINQEIQWLENLYCGLSEKWPAIALSELKLQKLQDDIKLLLPSIKNLQNQADINNQNLIHLCKDMINKNRQAEYLSVDCIASLISQAQNSHQLLKRKLQYKDFEDIIMFNIKVILPSKQVTSKNQDKQISIYQQIFDSKAAKKLSLIVKKHNLYGNDSKAINEYLKKIVEIQNRYHKINISHKKQFNNFPMQQIEKVIEKIQQIQFLLSNLNKKKQNLQNKINEQEQLLKNYELQKQRYIDQLNKKISFQYNQANCKNIKVDFQDMIKTQISLKYSHYKQLLLEKRIFFMNSKQQYNQSIICENNDNNLYN